MKQEIKNLVGSTIQSVQEAFPSIYTKQDVATLFNSLLEKVEALEEPTSGTLSELQIESMANDIAEMVSDLGMDLVDDYELEMSYREVELTSVEISERQIRSIATEVIKETLGLSEE